jgi:predicted transposase YdaD
LNERDFYRKDVSVRDYMRSISVNHETQGLVRGRKLGRDEGIAIGEEKGRQEGRHEGITIGEHRKCIESARQSLRKGLSVKTICAVLGLSERDTAFWDEVKKD